MSKDNTKAASTSLPEVTSVSEDQKSSSVIIVATTEIEGSSDAQKLLSGGSLAAEKTDSSLSPVTTSSDLSNEEDNPGESSDANVPSPSKDSLNKAEAASVQAGVHKVRFSSQVTEIDASIVSEATEADDSAISHDNQGSGDNALVRDLAETGTSGHSTAQSATGESEISDEHSGEIANRGCCPEHRGPFGYFRYSMMSIRESKYLLPFQFAMLSMPVSSGFMGAKYMEKCPASSAIPLLFFMMGVLGTVVICARIYSIFKKALFPHSDWSGQVRSALIAGILMLTILYTTELACFFNASPTFNHGSEDYCDETFYYFVSYMNYISIGLVIILLLLHCPGTNPCLEIRNPLILGEID